MPGGWSDDQVVAIEPAKELRGLPAHRQRDVTPNHMDRYDSFMDYAAAKHRVFMNQTDADVAVLNADDEIVSSWAGGLRARVSRFSVKSNSSAQRSGTCGDPGTAQPKFDRCRS